jgi:hypothetical protein
MKNIRTHHGFPAIGVDGEKKSESGGENAGHVP